MNTRQDRAPHLPACSPDVSAPTARVRRPKLYILLDDLFPPIRWTPPRRAAVALTAVAVAVGVTLLGLWVGGKLSQGLDGGSHGGLPPLWGAVTETEGDTETDTPTAEPTDAADPTDPEADTFPEEPTAPPESNGSPSDTLPAEKETAPFSTAKPTETVPGAAPDTESEPPIEGTDPPATVTDPPPEETEQPTAPPDTEPPAPIPDGCFPIISQDLSHPERGAGYMENAGVNLPATLPTDSPWKTPGPAVLIVNTHPYEGYSDGAAWYDPTAGGLALTDTPNAPDGVVALGSALARRLRELGVTVIHLRLATTAEESAADLYDRTEAAVRYYCRLYPDIGLVIDLRRSAEMTSEGGILRTEGSNGQAPCAQIRLSVSGGRGSAALGYDLAVALALRQELWETAPSLSRPVRVKSGGGMVSDLSDVRVLTVEMGAAGNTLAEAKSALEPLGRSIATILEKID